jgi:hypothetical protein
VEEDVSLMQKVNFGRIEAFAILDGEPDFTLPPQVLREFKPGGENGPRPETELADFELKREVVELFEHFGQLKNGVVHSLEVKHGLPFKVTTIENVT